MRNELDVNRVGISVAITSEIISFACLLLVVALPRHIMLFIANSMTHSFDFESIMTAGITLQSVVTGLVAIGFLSYVSGAIFAIVYNKLR
ncbi:hypothetical protein HYU11_04065 [Candidatus Woesearchaeota archaeon]|nr:hypothetical protein [Candidatus Woesearchaeota archaeon]